MPARLIITNGDSAAERIRAAGIEGDVLPWRDTLFEGPVPGNLVLEALSVIRAGFVAKAFGRPMAQTLAAFGERDAAFRNHGQYDAVELWLEHDLHDQLELLQLLVALWDDKRREGVRLVQADDYLGTQPAEGIAALAERAAPVSAEQFRLANEAWRAFTASKPDPLVALAARDTPALPHLAPALRRLLAELPSVQSGLGLTEKRILTALAKGAAPVHAVFQTTQEQEDARFLTDLAFFRLLAGLACAATPLVTGLAFRFPLRGAGSDEDYRAFARATVRLTDAGRAAVTGRFDHVRENGLDRWIGGTHLTPGTPWRRDPKGKVILS